jgi:hypothetical protein
MLYVFIALGVTLLIAGIVDRTCFGDGFGWFLFGAATLVVVLIICAAVHFTTVGDINTFKATKQTIQQQREIAMTEYERVTLTSEIISCNAWLANKQYWNKRPLGIAIPDEVDELTPIE